MTESIYSDKLEELIPRYPDLTKNDSQKVFFGLAEIHALESSREVEKRVKPGEYYKHQRTLGRAMMYAKRHLVMSDPGTGKTCGFTLTDEMIKADTNLFKVFYYVTPASLKQSTKTQIICKCTNNIYIDDKAFKKADIRRSGKIEFSTSYKMLTYDELFKMIVFSHNSETEITIGKPAAQLNYEFGYCVFNLDEVTKLITLKLSNVTNDLSDVITWTETLVGDMKILKEITDLDDPRIINSSKWYIQYWRLFHAIENSKVIFASGTIVSNRSVEFFMICNLLLPLNKQFDVELYANNVFKYNLAKYAPYLNGLISYVKASSVVARPRYIGKTLNKKYKVLYPMDETSENPQIGVKEYKSQFVLYKVELFGYQALKLYSIKEKLDSEKIASTISQILCCVDNLSQTGVKATNNGHFVYDIGQLDLRSVLMRQYSCSLLWDIVKIEIYALSLARSEGRPGPGVCFNYIDLTETVVPIMKSLFRYAGFDILEDFSMLIDKNSDYGDYCDVGKVSFKKLDKRPRAVFLSGDQSTNDKIRTLVTQLASSKDNINGEYIQFVNGSDVMAVGVNIGNSIRFIRPLPEWNESKDRQSRDRVFREDSHDGVREAMADKIEAETGVRPKLYDFDVFVDVYNMCAFSRYFNVNPKYYNFFVRDSNNPNEVLNSPFLMNNVNGVQNVVVDELGMLIDSMKIFHLIGFCKTGEMGNKIGTMTDIGYGTKGGSLCSEYAMSGELLYEKLNQKFNVNITPDLSNLGMANMDMLFSFSGVMFSAPMTEQFIGLLKSNALIYHNNCDFMSNNQVGIYPEGHVHVIIFKILTVLKDQNGTPLVDSNGVVMTKPRNVTEGAKNNRDYFLVPASMRYISPSESQYITMEQKSFAAKRITRYAKQVALDCIVEEERNYNPKDVDGTIECDYDTCKYTCSSNILPGKSDDAFIYEGGGEFWSNYEILYGDLIISDCKEAIISMLKQKSEVKISEIFEKLLPKCQRDYFINIAIYQLVIKKKRVNNTFGTIAYVAANKDTLYLSEEFPRSIKKNSENIGSYNRKLIAVKTDPDYRNHMNIDGDIIRQIEELNHDERDPNYTTEMKTKVVSLILAFKVPYISIPKLIENSFGRIAYRGSIDEQLQLPQYAVKKSDFIIVNIIYSIRCFSFQFSGHIYYVHNQPIVKAPTKQGEIRRLIGAKDPFRVFVIDEGKPAWRNATQIENEKFRVEAVKEIQENLMRTINKNLVINWQGQVYNVPTESLYYLNYYNGVYRLSKKTDQAGEKLDSLTNTSILPFVEWMKSSNFAYVGYNMATLDAIINASQHGKDSQRNELIKKFFEDNDLVFRFSIEALTDKSGRR